MIPLWQRLAEHTKQGGEYVISWWLQNRDKYQRLLQKPGAIPALLALVCLSTALLLTNQWQIVVDDNILAVTKDKNAVTAYIDSLDCLNKELYSDASLMNNVRLARSYGTPALGSQELEPLLTENLNWGVDGVAIMVDGEEVVCLKSKTSADKVLEDIKEKAKAQLASLYKAFHIVTLNIREDTQIVEKPVAINKLVDEEAAQTALASSANQPRPRTMVVSRSGGARNSLSQAATEPEALINVEVVAQVKETKTIPYETKVVKDSSLYKGEKKTVTKGKNGLDEIITEVTLVNGEIEDSKLISTSRKEEPVTAVIKEGTKVAVVTGSGRFVWPTKGYVSSPYGMRWGSFHRGLDIAAPAGTAIVAADSGVVVFAGTRGNYGRLVEIDHGNGYVTRYAHCSQLLVSKGARVSRGQLIAKVGRTGFATGNHVHFEVLYRGANKNPMSFLK